MIGLLLTLVIVGVVLYVLNRVVPIDGNIRLIINAIVILCVCVYVLRFFGLIGGGRGHLFGV